MLVEFLHCMHICTSRVAFTTEIEKLQQGTAAQVKSTNDCLLSQVPSPNLSHEHLPPSNHLLDSQTIS